MNGAAGRSELDGVREEIVDDLPQPHAIGLDGARPVRQLQRQPSLPGARPLLVHDIAQELLHPTRSI